MDVRGWSPGLLSGLVLAGANRAQNQVAGEEIDTGILTAEEIGAMNLDGVDLVVLSACETGLGQAAGGEGLLGLQRAFQSAGARRVVASLWKVPDRETRQLMERFYRNRWEKNLSPLEALHEAQLWMLCGGPTGAKAGDSGPRSFKPDALPESAKTKDGRLSPHYWAAFVLSGDWR